MNCNNTDDGLFRYQRNINITLRIILLTNRNLSFHDRNNTLTWSSKFFIFAHVRASQIIII